MYEEDACFDDGSGNPAHGHKQIRDALAALIEQKPTLDCHEFDVVENGNLAVLRARWIYTGTGADGEHFETRGRSIEIVRRQSNGSWKFVIDLPSGASELQLMGRLRTVRQRMTGSVRHPVVLAG